MSKWTILAAALALATPLYAQTPAAATTEAAVMTDGVVRKIDTASNKITLKHGPIANLDMPGMTMVFRVASPALLDRVKVGDAVKFHVEKIDGALTLTALEAAR